MYEYGCEYRDGIVQEQVVEQEALKLRAGLVILEEEIATRRKSPKRMKLVPVAAFA